jgi:hypothetical protein
VTGAVRGDFAGSRVNLGFAIVRVSFAYSVSIYCSVNNMEACAGRMRGLRFFIVAVQETTRDRCGPRGRFCRLPGLFCARFCRRPSKLSIEATVCVILFMVCLVRCTRCSTM